MSKFSRATYIIFAMLFFALPLLAAATAVERRTDPNTVCTTGTLDCCNSVQSATSSAVSTALGGVLAGILSALGLLTGNAGLTCSPIDLLSPLTATSCTQQAACCNGNTYNGVVTLSCVPVTLVI